MSSTPAIQHLTSSDIRAIREGLSEIRMESQPELGSMNQADFGKLIGGVHWVTVARWESGDRTPRTNYLRLLLRQFEVVSRYRARKEQENKGEMF